MEHYVTLDEAQNHLDQLIDAAVNGETVLIMKDGDQIVQLVPVNRRTAQPHFGSGRGLMVMADDFDEPLPDFDEYMR
jgi:antitoxin (DNA-binding transcriptional repressor) of toxin-antitoxin stability system